MYILCEITELHYVFSSQYGVPCLRHNKSYQLVIGSLQASYPFSQSSTGKGREGLEPPGSCKIHRSIPEDRRMSSRKDREPGARR